MRDLYSNLAVAVSVAPAVHAATVEGAAVDVSKASGAVAIVTTAAIAGDGAFGAKLQESATGVDGWADVAPARVQSNAPAVLEANKAYRLGYLGRMPFVRAVLVKDSGTSLAASVVVALRPMERPVL